MDRNGGCGCVSGSAGDFLLVIYGGGEQKNISPIECPGRIIINIINAANSHPSGGEDIPIP